MTKSGVTRYAAQHNLIVVAPDTSPRHTGLPQDEASYDFGSGAGFYLDALVEPWKKFYNMGSYVGKELPGWIEAYFPVKKGIKSILGHSMGGHGALVYGLTYPDQWKSVSAFAPICHPVIAPWGKKAFGGYLGSDQAMWEAYDATCLLEKGYIHPVEIFIDQGKEDKFLKEGQLNPFDFEKTAREKGQKTILRFHEGYDHSYWFIQTFIKDHIAFHARYLG